MAEKETSISNSQSIRHPNPISSIISKFTEVINFRFPPPPAKKVETERKTAGDAVIPGGEAVEDSNPATVRFPQAHPTTVAPLKLQEDEVEGDTNPVFLWQVYAIGGFFILRWVLARWNERRRANNKSSNEDSPPSPQPGASAEGNE
ncbi:hypothetical protein R6Q59_029831 [Mikania micrantha]|uniref:Uncharacterized protein n=1 Tax=Mikania micrantha TaxID=192012 RepID=A0A5N6LTD9_9ASTR|nr:hypothetical protein E3N88_38127 [Mikania micrantha]